MGGTREGVKRGVCWAKARIKKLGKGGPDSKEVYGRPGVETETGTRDGVHRFVRLATPDVVPAGTRETEGCPDTFPSRPPTSK